MLHIDLQNVGFGMLMDLVGSWYEFCFILFWQFCNGILCSSDILKNFIVFDITLCLCVGL